MYVHIGMPQVVDREQRSPMHQHLRHDSACTLDRAVNHPMADLSPNPQLGPDLRGLQPSSAAFNGEVLRQTIRDYGAHRRKELPPVLGIVEDMVQSHFFKIFFHAGDGANRQ